MTSRYCSNKENILDSNYRNLGILPVCETFDKSEIETVLGQTGCVALRIYYSMDANYKVHAILVGVDSNDADILVNDSEKIMEKSRRCPTDCPPASDLNS